MNYEKRKVVIYIYFTYLFKESVLAARYYRVLDIYIKISKSKFGDDFECNFTVARYKSRKYETFIVLFCKSLDVTAMASFVLASQAILNPLTHV